MFKITLFVQHPLYQTTKNEPLTTVYTNLKMNNPNIIISLSKFSQLKPQGVKTNRWQKLYQSKCEYCTNPYLKIDVLNKVCDKKEIPNCIANKHDLIDITLCKNQEGKEFHNKKCISRECLECGVQKLDDYLQPLIEKVKDEDVTWQYWTNK